MSLLSTYVELHDELMCVEREIKIGFGTMQELRILHVARDYLNTKLDVLVKELDND